MFVVVVEPKEAPVVSFKHKLCELSQTEQERESLELMVKMFPFTVSTGGKVYLFSLYSSQLALYCAVGISQKPIIGYEGLQCLR